MPGRGIEGGGEDFPFPPAFLPGTVTTVQSLITVDTIERIEAFEPIRSGIRTYVPTYVPT